MYSFWLLFSSIPFGMLCHFEIHPLQHVAVACCAINVGCPLIGVCFPSFSITLEDNLLLTKSLVCSSIFDSPFSFYIFKNSEPLGTINVIALSKSLNSLSVT